MKAKKLMVMIAAMLTVGSFASYKLSQKDADTDAIILANVEALAGGESGAKCPNGCSNIGWGMNKILECDCNYDRLSCCDRWGC